MNRIVNLHWSAAVAVAVALSGCSWFHHRDNYYAKATEARPLEVPPDLDAPPSSGELVVPGADRPAAPATSAPPAIGSAPPAVAASGSGLHVADSVDNAWRRVGLALERAQVGTISARDEAAHSYTVEVAGLRAPSPPPPAEEHHWYTRILHPFGGGKSDAASATESRPVSGRLTVKVLRDGDGARVEVEGAAGDSAEAAQRVLAVLRERLT